MEENEKKLSTIGWITRISALLAIVCFFFPFCTVSCSGQSYDITGTDIAFGMKFGEYQSDGYLQFTLLLLVPVLVLALSFLTQKTAAYIVGIAGTVVDLILMFQFTGKLKEETQSLYCTMEYSSFFYLNILCHLLIIGCSIGFFLWRGSGTHMGNYAEKQEDDKWRVSEKASGRMFCTKCGEPLKEGSLFCTKCGHKVE